MQCENKDEYSGCALEINRLHGYNHRRLVGAFDYTIGDTAEIEMRLAAAAGHNDDVDIFISTKMSCFVMPFMRYDTLKAYGRVIRL